MHVLLSTAGIMIAVVACSIAASEEKQMYKDYNDALGYAIRGLYRNQIEEVRRAFDAFPDLAKQPEIIGGSTWITHAVTNGQRELLEFFIFKRV